jgi:Skp family chaperone for outer membrane proteins
LTLSEERCKSLVAQHEDLRKTKNKEIADIRHELETKTVAFEKKLTDSRDKSAQQALRYEEMVKNSEKKIRELETA